jgi:hypothetical protein
LRQVPFVFRPSKLSHNCVVRKRLESPNICAQRARASSHLACSALTSVARPLVSEKYQAPRGGAIEPAHTLGPIPISDARENIEATRIAGELRKLAKAGALKDGAI